MRRSRVVLASFCLLMLAFTPGRAQRVNDGFWIGFGVGGGWDASDAVDGGRAAVAGYLRLGGTVSQHFLLGGEFGAWIRSPASDESASQNTTVALLAYPLSGGGAFLKAGVGLARWTRTVDLGGESGTVAKSGVGITTGAGYDFRVAGNLYLTPNFDWLVQRVDDRWNEPRVNHILLLTLGLTWH